MKNVVICTNFDACHCGTPNWQTSFLRCGLQRVVESEVCVFGGQTNAQCQATLTIMPGRLRLQKNLKFWEPFSLNYHLLRLIALGLTIQSWFPSTSSFRMSTQKGAQIRGNSFRAFLRSSKPLIWAYLTPDNTIHFKTTCSVCFFAIRGPASVSVILLLSQVSNLRTLHIFHTVAKINNTQTFLIHFKFPMKTPDVRR